jgi:NAD-dependent dihydropyrimidine dehydrogenase PreA subunit
MTDHRDIATTNDAAGQPPVLLCTCAHYDIIPKATKDAILDFLARAGVAVEVVADLCGMAASRDPLLQRWSQAEAPIIMACFPRAIRWLFHAAGVPLDGKPIRFFNMRTQSPDEIIAALSVDGPRTLGSNHQSSIIDQQSTWVPWFPVIDYDRCKNCKQCLNFCLFGVYALSQGGRVEVQKPQGCKTNCPACARMCPAKAIIFPKYTEPPINGDEADTQSPAEEKAAADVRAFVKGDVYDKLRRRASGGARFSTEPRDDSGPREGGGHG